MRQQVAQTVDPLLVQVGALCVYWAVVGLVALTGLATDEATMLMALAPLLFIAVEIVVGRVALRMAR